MVGTAAVWRAAELSGESAPASSETVVYVGVEGRGVIGSLGFCDSLRCSPLRPLLHYLPSSSISEYPRQTKESSSHSLAPRASLAACSLANSFLILLSGCKCLLSEPMHLIIEPWLYPCPSSPNSLRSASILNHNAKLAMRWTSKTRRHELYLKGTIFGGFQNFEQDGCPTAL